MSDRIELEIAGAKGLRQIERNDEKQAAPEC
jgi:hypothetical protein